MESRDALIHEEQFPMQIVCIYAMREEPFYHELQTHLSLWQREGYIQWLETEVGRDVEQTMHAHLRQADLILLLISPSFFAHDLCYTAMKTALQEHMRRKAPVVPVLTRASDWKESACRGLHALPDNEQPLAEWSHPEQAYENVRAGLARFIPGLSVQVDGASAEAIYRKQVVKAYEWLNFSGYDRSDGLLPLGDVPLEKIFVRLSLTVEKVVREPGSEDSASRAKSSESRQRKRVTTVQEPIELGEALGNHLLIVGEPGAGKSVLLRWLAVTFAQACQRETDRVGPLANPDRLPVLVELGHLPDHYLRPESREIPNWLQFLPSYLASQMAFTNTPPQLLTQALAEGRCLLLFDGLDEVADRQARTRLARSLVELARLSPGNRIIIGSRLAGVSESEGALRPLFQHCQIQRFTPKEVQQFFRFWYALDRSLSPEQQRDAADTLYARVSATPAILQLATTPLLSTILVLIWRNEGNLPERQVDLYEYCCRLLIERWEASHDVAYQGVQASMDWGDHLLLLTSLAYAIHSQELRTSTSKEELVPLLAQALQTAGFSNEQAATVREAKHFLDTLGLRSGLLQYQGNDRYGFPHLTFQEYLVARYIAAQPDPDYIDLVMTHLHEAWWQEVHVLTIAHLGSRNGETSKASELILTLLHLYRPPSRSLRSSRNRWLRLREPERLVPQVELDRQIAWILAREFEMVVKGSAEWVPGGMIAKVETVLSAQAAFLVRHILYNENHYQAQKALLLVIGQLLQRQGNEAIVRTLREALHDADPHVQIRAVQALGQMGVGNGTVVKVLLEVLYDANGRMSPLVAVALGQVGTGNEAVVNALLKSLGDAGGGTRSLVVEVLGQVGVGNEAVVSVLLKALGDPDHMVRWSAAKALGQVGAGNEAVASVLLEAMYDDIAMQWTTVEALGEVGVGNEVVVSALIKVLNDADVNVQRRAAASLGQVGAGNEAAVSALLRALHNAAWFVQVEATASLSRMGVSKEAVVNALLMALRDANKARRAGAADALGEVGVGNEAVASALLKALHDGEWIVRQQAAASLGKVGVGNEAVASALLKALHDGGGFVRLYATASLGQLGIGNEAVVSALLKVWDKVLDNGHDHDPMLHVVAESLGQIGVGNEAVVSTLLKALEEGDWFVREQAAKILGQVGAGNEVVVSALLIALHDAYGHVRQQAAASLGKLEIKDALQLRRVLVALNSCLHSWDSYVSGVILASICQLLDGRPIPGYKWEPLRERRVRHR